MTSSLSAWKKAIRRELVHIASKQYRSPIRRIVWPKPSDPTLGYVYIGNTRAMFALHPHGRSITFGGTMRALKLDVSTKKNPSSLVGHRVELHVATDDWMRGDRYGTIVGIGKARDYYSTSGGPNVRVRPYIVLLDKSGQRKRFHPDNVFLID